MTGKERRGVPVLPHSQDQQVESGGHLNLVFFRRLLQVRPVRFHSVNRSDPALKPRPQRFPDQPVVASMITPRNGPLIREEKLNLLPWNGVIAGKLLVHGAGTLSSGKGDRNRAAGSGARPDSPGNVVGSGTGEHLGRNED